MTTHLTNNQLIKNSFSIVREKKSLLFFSFCNLIINTALLFSMLFPLYKIESVALETHHITGKMYLLFLIVLILFFTIRNLINLFFSAGLIHCALHYFQHNSFSIVNGLKIAFRFIPKLIYLNIIMTTLGPAVRFSESWITKWPRTHFAVNVLHNVKWRAATAFVLPILITKKVTPFHAIEYSAQLTHDKYGSKGIRINTGMSILLVRIASFLPIIIAVLIGVKSIVVIGTLITLILFFLTSAINMTTIIMTVCALYIEQK